VQTGKPFDRRRRQLRLPRIEHPRQEQPERADNGRQQLDPQIDMVCRRDGIVCGQDFDGLTPELVVADKAGVLARITGILAENDISIDAVLQRESADGENQTDLIILTHNTVEGRMKAALVQMQALPTVLAPIVKIRKEELN
jgi:predicted amino acid-binding ACT domain protein